MILVLTAILIACMAIFGHFNFQHWYTYAAMVIICIICLAQAGVLFFTYKKITGIDDTTTPALHLQQWEAYYVFRKKQKAVNMPLYYIALNLAMGLYFFEVLSGRPFLNIIIFLSIYAAWMLFSYFYLGKKNLKKEETRLQEIIDELKGIETQLSNQI